MFVESLQEPRATLDELTCDVCKRTVNAVFIACPIACEVNGQHRVHCLPVNMVTNVLAGARPVAKSAAVRWARVSDLTLVLSCRLQLLVPDFSHCRQQIDTFKLKRAITPQSISVAISPLEILVAL